MAEQLAVPGPGVPTYSDGEDAHAISAKVSLQELRPWTLKHGDTFAVLERNGDAIPAQGGPEGLYHRDTRHLSRLELMLSGCRPLLLSASATDDGAALTCDLANPDLSQSGQPALARDQIQLRRTKFLSGDTCFERILVRSFADRPVTLRIELLFGADFADLFEVRGERRRRHGERHAARVGGSDVTLSYTGLDRRRRTTHLRFEPEPTRLDPVQAAYDLALEPGSSRLLFIEIRCDSGEGRASPPASGGVGAGFLRSLREGYRERLATARRGVAVKTSDAVFDQMVRRSVSDLGMLTTMTPHGPFPYAGIPWFSTVFGRDSLVTALLTMWMDPSLALGVLRHLAAFQATETNAAADAEPGKILHEMRHGEMAILGEVPFRRYYGSVDSTLLFVMVAGAYLDRTGDVAALRGLWANIDAALHWIEAHGDHDGDGFLAYGRMTEGGLANQGWKDSWDSVSHADGTLAQGPIALCEVQAYAYAALQAGARIGRALGVAADRVAGLVARADALRQRFEAVYWCEEMGSYALALDGARRPCRVRASNAGHALLCGIASPDRAAMVARGLMSSTCNSGWGIRTLAANAARYNPMSYHNGSVWPHDNALIGLGFARYGMRAEATQLLEGLATAASQLDLQRLPELFCGFPRRSGRGPTAYPVACAPQAWAAAAPIGLLGACLGIGFDPAARLVRLDRPVLPVGLDHVMLRGLTLGNARIDLDLRRAAGGAVAMSVAGRHGDIGAVLIA